MQRTYLRVLCVSLVAACGGGGGDGTDSSVQGVATYRDSSTDAAGAPRDPSTPPAQSATVTVTIRGNGTLTGLDPTCLDSASGAFDALYSGDAQLDGSGGYVSSMGSADAVLQTPSGCDIPDLTVGVISDIVVRAELDATTQNCDTYCSASARADAEAECSAAADRATCWANSEASAKAACQTECTTQSTKIVAETTIGASGLGELDADALRAAAFGDVDANLTFDTLE